MGLRWAVLPLALWLAPLPAQEPPVRSGAVASGSLSFDGRATAGDFTGTTTTVTGALVGAATLATATGWVEAPVVTLKTGKDRRDRDLNKSMESEKYPTLRFELDRVEAGAGPADSLPAVLHGRMVLHGVTRDVVLPSTLHFSPTGVRVHSSFPLNLKDYRIGGLSKAFGLLKMYEDIVVHVDVTFSYQ